MYDQIFFTNILRLLDERGMTKDKLADAAGMSLSFLSFLSDLTNGKANPSLKIMEAIARALDASLPALLEMTDLDRETLDALAGGKPPSSLPNGLVRVAAVLTEYHAFTVRQWYEADRKLITFKKSGES